MIQERGRAGLARARESIDERGIVVGIFEKSN